MVDSNGGRYQDPFIALNPLVVSGNCVHLSRSRIRDAGTYKGSIVEDCRADIPQ